MSYEKTSYHDILATVQSSMGYQVEPVAEAEAENIMAVWDIVKRWFGYMQAGEALYKHPDPTWKSKPGRKPLTPEMADLLIKEITEDFAIERGRFPSTSGLGPGFERLMPEARLAFAQELYDTIMTEVEIGAKAIAALPLDCIRRD